METLSLTKRSLPRRGMGLSDITEMEQVKFRLLNWQGKDGIFLELVRMP